MRHQVCVIVPVLFSIFFATSNVSAKTPTRICSAKLESGVSIEFPCPEKKAPSPDENSCTPYCDQSGQWCTDCKGNGKPIEVDEDGFPLKALELEEEGYSCFLYEEDDRIIGDCEIYGWVCENGRCDDSEGSIWPEDLQKFVIDLDPTRCESTFGLDNHGNTTCNWGCGGGVDVTCTVGHSLWVCKVSVGGKEAGSVSGWNNNLPNPCSGSV